MEVGEQVDAASVAEGELAFTGAQSDGFEDVALAGAGFTGDEQVVVALNEVELSELEDELFVELGLELPVEGLEGLALDEAAGLDAASDAAVGFVGNFGGEQALEPGGVIGAVTSGGGELVVESLEGVGPSEKGEVLADALVEIAGGDCGRGVVFASGHESVLTG